MNTMLALVMFGGMFAAQEGEAGASDPHRQEMVNRLGTMRVTVDFNNTPFEEAIAYLRDFSGLNIVVDPEVYQQQSADSIKITLKAKDLLFKSVLKLMLGSHGLSAESRDGVLMIVPKGRLDKAVTLELYDVRDLLVKLQDHPGPKVELTSPGKPGVSNAGIIVTGLEEPQPIMTEEFITTMVKENTGGKSWDENPNASLVLTNGVLAVSQSKRVHEEIKRFIGSLRQFK